MTLKLFARRLCPRTAVFAVVHDVGKLLPTEDRLSAAETLFHRVLRSAPEANLRYLAPTLVAHRELMAIDAALGRLFTPLPLPYPWRPAYDTELHPRPHGALRFGLIGAASRERLEPFCRLARDIKRRFPSAEFVLAGHLTANAEELGEDLRFLDDAPEAPLPLDELGARIDALDYAVWIGPIHRWRLSASFLDALAHVKPSLALRTPFSAFLFETMGDIGYLCADHRDLAATAARLIENVPGIRYRQQCANIVEQRSRLSPSTVAASLRDAVLGLAIDGRPAP